jgi:hypothetical protein
MVTGRGDSLDSKNARASSTEKSRMSLLTRKWL